MEKNDNKSGSGTQNIEDKSETEIERSQLTETEIFETYGYGENNPENYSNGQNLENNSLLDNTKKNTSDLVVDSDTNIKPNSTFPTEIADIKNPEEQLNENLANDDNQNKRICQKKEDTIDGIKTDSVDFFSPIESNASIYCEIPSKTSKESEESMGTNRCQCEKKDWQPILGTIFNDSEYSDVVEVETESKKHKKIKSDETTSLKSEAIEEVGKNGAKKTNNEALDKEEYPNVIEVNTPSKKSKNKRKETGKKETNDSGDTTDENTEINTNVRQEIKDSTAEYPYVIGWHDLEKDKKNLKREEILLDSEDVVPKNDNNKKYTSVEVQVEFQQEDYPYFIDFSSSTQGVLTAEPAETTSVNSQHSNTEPQLQSKPDNVTKSVRMKKKKKN